MRNWIDLFEMFDTPINFTWESKKDNEWIAQASIGDKEFKAVFFASLDNPERRWSMTMTGSFGRGSVQEALALWAGVIQCMKEFTEANKPKMLVFNAISPSRTKLYAALLKRHAGDLTEMGFTVAQNNSLFFLRTKDA